MAGRATSPAQGVGSSSGRRPKVATAWTRASPSWTSCTAAVLCRRPARRTEHVQVGRAGAGRRQVGGRDRERIGLGDGPAHGRRDQREEVAAVGVAAHVPALGHLRDQVAVTGDLHRQRRVEAGLEAGIVERCPPLVPARARTLGEAGPAGKAERPGEEPPCHNSPTPPLRRPREIP